jgi:phage terminase large subunit
VFLEALQPRDTEVNEEVESGAVIRFPKKFKALDDPYRYKVIYGGRGSAKSWTVARKLLIRGMEKPLLILCTRELQKSIKQSVHRLLSNQIDKMGLGDFYDILNDKIVGINGTEFIFFGIKHNTDEIKSTEGVDICWIEEAHNLTETGFDIIEPTIRKEDSEIWIVYNTRFKFDYVHQTFVMHEPPPSSLVIFANYWDNPYFPEVLRRSMEHMKATNYDKYLNIWCGELKKLAEGAIFGKQVTKVEKDNRRLYIPIEADAIVCTFADIGKNDETAFWFMQFAGNQYRMIDYFEGRLEEVKYYAKFITQQDHVYEMHYLPHDAAHEKLGMEDNVEKQFNQLGVRPTTIVPRTPDKMNAIQTARSTMAKTWFHKGDDLSKPFEEAEGYYPYTENEDMMTRTRRCERGWEALCNYRYKYKEEEDVFQFTPYHDWASNGADAFMQFAQSDWKPAGRQKYDDWDVPING